MAISFSLNDDIIIPSVDREIYLGLAGNDAYILSDVIAENSTVVIQDTEGSNIIQLVHGLKITSSTVYADALQLALSNGSQVQITGASSFIYEPGGNATTGDTGTEQNYTTFVEEILGTTVPAEGEDPTKGGAVVIGEDQTPPAIESLAITLQDISTSGKVGSEVQVDAVVEHTGDAETVEFTLTQGETVATASLSLQETDPAVEEVSMIFENTWGFDPGAVSVEVSVAEGSIVETAEKTFGLYELEGISVDYDYWQWSDPEQSPFDIIGQTVVEHEGELWIGTGFLISPRHIMTNAHVISYEEDHADLSRLSDVDFYLGRNGGTLYEEQEGNHYEGEHVYLQQDEWWDMWPDTDMSIVTLDNEVEDQDAFDWFWNSRLDTDRDMIGESVLVSGYPSEYVVQGEDELGNSTYFQWQAQGEVTNYVQGYDDYGAESGGLMFTSSLTFSGGASGSPVIFQDEYGEYQFAGAYTGELGGNPVAAALDSAAYDWALTIVQDDGYLLDMDFVDGAVADADMGPDMALPETLNDTIFQEAPEVNAAEITVQGVSGEWDDLSLAA